MSQQALALSALELRNNGRTWREIAALLGATRHDLVEAVATYRAHLAHEASVRREREATEALFGGWRAL